MDTDVTPSTPAPGSATAERAMTYDEVVLGRRTIRGFTDEPVSRAVLEEMMSLIRLPAGV